MKRLIALCLVFVTVLSVFPATVFAADDSSEIEDAGKTEGVTTQYDEPDRQSDYTYVETEKVTHVNPLYAGIISQAKSETFESVMPADEPVFCSSISEAAAVLREGMKARQNTIVFQLSTADKDIVEDIFNAAIEHTGVPDEGDYLRWHYLQYDGSGNGYFDGEMFVMTYTYAVTYHSNAQQEAAVDSLVQSIIAPLSGLTDYGKILGIYDYLTKNVAYDHANLEDDSYTLKYTTYAALNNGTAVCQGYASAFYRLALEMGIDCRVIPGTGKGGEHGWNIVKLDGKYYNVDSTWDAGRSAYVYFLKGSGNFGDHIRNAGFDTDSFHSAYPMAAQDYPLYSGNCTHKWDAGKITKAATLFTTGVKTYTCETCKTTKTETVSKLAPAKPYKIANVVSGVHVYWKAVDGAAKYGVWRSETGKNGTYKWLANPTVPHFTDTKVESGKTYYYKVTAVNSAGTHSEKSEPIGVTYVSTPDITSRFNKAAGITVGWNKVTGATGYAIYRKSYSGSDAWVRVGTIEGNSTFTWQDTSVKDANGKVYKYTVRALAGSDMKTLSGCRNAGRTMARLTSRTLNSATKASATSIKCSWSTSSAVTGYEVRFMVGDQVYKTFTVGNYKTGVKTFTGLEAGKTYKIQVRSYLKVDGMGFYSAWSTAKNVTL